MISALTIYNSRRTISHQLKRVLNGKTSSIFIASTAILVKNHYFSSVSNASSFSISSGIPKFARFSPKERLKRLSILRFLKRIMQLWWLFGGVILSTPIVFWLFKNDEKWRDWWWNKLIDCLRYVSIHYNNYNHCSKIIDMVDLV